MSKASQDIRSISDQLEKLKSKLADVKDKWDKERIITQINDKLFSLKHALINSGISNWESVYNSMRKSMKV